MFEINQNYLNLSGNYLFSAIQQKVKAFLAEQPDADLIRLGIGDVTLPLTPTVIAALHQATDEMARRETFHGYGPEQGYEFLRQAVADHEYRARGLDIAPAEIFISDGSKCDVGNIQEIFSAGCIVAISDPVYPVYLDSNLMAGRRIVYLPSTCENRFSPALPSEPVDVIYLCSPNNPTGTVLPREELIKFVDYARRHRALLLFDSAYSDYIREPGLVRSIYEIPGADEVAIEFKSFSKTAGFTGLRCAYTVIPRRLQYGGVSLHSLWNRRQCTKFNGVAYIVQRAAAAVYTPDGRREVAGLIDYYMTNADLIRSGLEQGGFEVYGGKNAPYIWWKLPNGFDSMHFFDKLLSTCRIIGTPGVGFGKEGEGYFRLTAFGDRDQPRGRLIPIAAAAAIL